MLIYYDECLDLSEKDRQYSSPGQTLGVMTLQRADSGPHLHGPMSVHS